MANFSGEFFQTQEHLYNIVFIRYDNLIYRSYVLALLWLG
jgi:hypothetical protein